VAQGKRQTNVDEIEQWFISRGIPHLMAGYSARTDIWTRAIPLLGVGYLLGGLNALDLRKSLAWNLVVALAVLVILVVTWVLMTRLRNRPAAILRRSQNPAGVGRTTVKRRGAREDVEALAGKSIRGQRNGLERATSRWTFLPTEVGTAELAAFVVGPVLPSLILGQWRDGMRAFVEGLGVLLTIYFVTSYGLFAMFRWAANRARSQVVLFFNVVVRVLPLLLLAITFLFINAEVWQVAGTLRGWPYWVVIALFFALGAFFVLSRIPSLVGALSTFDDWVEVRALVADTPAAGLVLPSAGNPAEPPLQMRERLNIGLVSVFSQALQITLVVLAMFTFFVIFGGLAINATTSAAWTQAPVHILSTWAEGKFVVTEELLRVSGFLGAFTGMYFTVVLSTDATYREEFTEDVAPQIRQAFAVRIAYLHTRGSD
jgi:hypothetical protein